MGRVTNWIKCTVEKLPKTIYATKRLNNSKQTVSESILHKEGRSS